MKTNNIQGKGFTLIEILIVVAIIGILATAVFVMIGDNKRTLFAAAMATAKSTMPFAQECLFRQKALDSYAADRATDGGVSVYSGSTAADIICNGSTTTWPTLSIVECGYVITDATAGIYGIDCGSIGSLTCTASNGGCVRN